MTTMLRKANNIIQASTGRLFLAGLVGIIGYNGLLWRRDRQLVDRLQVEHAHVPVLSRMPKVSVLVAAWNEGERIDAHIRSFLALNYPTIELLLCAGGADDTLARARQYASERVIVLEQHPGEGKQRALARCLSHASGEIIYLTDADCVYDDEALVRLLAPLIEDGEQAATGGSRPLDDQASRLLPSYLWASDVVAGAHQAQYVDGLLGRNAAVTRQAIERIGGLDFTARTGTDYLLARRLIGAGISIRYVGASIVPSEYPETLRDYRRRQSRWLRNLLIHGWRSRAQRDVRLTLRTMVTGVLMLLAPLGRAAFGDIVLILWLLLLAHAGVSKLRYALFTARLHRRPVPARLLAGILPLTLADFAVWALPILDVLHPGRREQW